MPSGGSRIGAGRPKKVVDPSVPKPKRVRKPRAVPKKVAKKVVRGAVARAPEGKKLPGTPQSWPFGTAPKASETPAKAAEPLSALQLFQQIYRDESVEMRSRLQAAAQALPFEMGKPAPVGKKEAKADAAQKVGGNRFAAQSAPLALVKR